jgi:transmembrane sensor
MAPGEDIEARAADWLATLDRPDEPAAVHAAFEAWCRADPRHLASYLRLLEVWNRLDALNAAFPALADVRTVAASLPDWPGSAPGRSPLRRHLFVALALAAVLLVIVVGLAWWQWSRPFGLEIGGQHYLTALGGFEQIKLSDGSVVELNTNSELRVRLRKSRREITLLRGEATFEVAPDTARPFIVVAGNMAVRAVGTVFNVEEDDKRVEVLVTKGVVAVGPPREVVARRGAPAMVDAGEMAIAASSIIKVESVNEDEIARRLAWHQGMLEFDGQSLAEVAAQFNRYNERKLVIADPVVGRVRIGGYFRATDVSAFVHVLQERFGVVAVQETGRTLLRH